MLHDDQRLVASRSGHNDRVVAGGDAHGKIVDTLQASPEPSIRWKVRTRVLDEAPDSAGIVALREVIRGSRRVQGLLTPLSSAKWPDAYSKWQGAHWVLAALADLGYPPGDPALHPPCEQVLDKWLDTSARHRVRGDGQIRSVPASRGASDARPDAVGAHRSRATRCGS